VVLYSNRITRLIPNQICQWKQLRVLDLSDNLLAGELPDCGTKVAKQGNSSSTSMPHSSPATPPSLNIRTLLLSSNGLSGEFPLLLQSCANLLVLDLSHNKFTRNLPAWIGERLQNLEILALRSNTFSSHIPVEITRLPALQFLDLANNNLSGTLPQSLANLKAFTTTAYPGGNRHSCWLDKFESVTIIGIRNRIHTNDLGNNELRNLTMVQLRPRQPWEHERPGRLRLGRRFLLYRLLLRVRHAYNLGHGRGGGSRGGAMVQGRERRWEAKTRRCDGRQRN
jgi:Leucine-rich repeat (LRR) protein